MLRKLNVMEVVGQEHAK